MSDEPPCTGADWWDIWACLRHGDLCPEQPALDELPCAECGQVPCSEPL